MITESRNSTIDVLLCVVDHCGPQVAEGFSAPVEIPVLWSTCHRRLLAEFARKCVSISRICVSR